MAVGSQVVETARDVIILNHPVFEVIMQCLTILLFPKVPVLQSRTIGMWLVQPHLQLELIVWYWNFEGGDHFSVAPAVPCRLPS